MPLLTDVDEPLPTGKRKKKPNPLLVQSTRSIQAQDALAAQRRAEAAVDIVAGHQSKELLQGLGGKARRILAEMTRGQVDAYTLGGELIKELFEPVARTLPSVLPVTRKPIENLFGPEKEWYRPPGADYEVNREGVVRPVAPLPGHVKALEIASVAIPATAEGRVITEAGLSALRRVGLPAAERGLKAVGREIVETPAVRRKVLEAAAPLRMAEEGPQAASSRGPKPRSRKAAVAAKEQVPAPARPELTSPAEAAGVGPPAPVAPAAVSEGAARIEPVHGVTALEPPPPLPAGAGAPRVVDQIVAKRKATQEAAQQELAARRRAKLEEMQRKVAASPGYQPPEPPPPPAPPRKPIWAMTPEEAAAFAGKGARAPGLPPPAPPRGPVPPSGPPPELPSGRRPGGPIGKPEPQPFTPAEDLAILEKAINPPQPTAVEAALDLGRRFKQSFIDKNDPFVRLQKETGIPVHDLAQLAADARGAGDEIVRRLVKPVLSPISDDLPWLEKYMVAKRNEDILARNPAAKLPGGMRGWPGTLQAQQEMVRRLGSERFKRIEAVANRLWDLDEQHNMRLLRAEGLLDDDGLRNILADNRHYIPWDRADFEGMIERAVRGGPASVSATGLQKLDIAGSTRALDKSLARFVAKFALTQEKVSQNRAARALVQSLVQLQEQTGEELVRFVEPAREIKRAAGVSGRPAPILSKAEHSKVWDTVSYFEKGKKVTVDVPALYAQVAKGMGEEAASWWMTVLKIASTPLRSGAVVYQPVWPLINTIMNTSSMWFREGVVPLGRDYRAGVLAVLKKNELFSEVAGQGLLMRGFVESMEDMTQLQRATRSMRGAITLRSPKDAALLIPRLIRETSIASEQAARIATYSKLKRQGVDEIARAKRTKEVAVDFSKMGSKMRALNAAVPFTNAALQGTLLVGRTIYRRPGWAAIAASPFITASVIARLNNMRFETSKDIPAYEYTRNWIFQFGEGTRKDGTKFPLYFKIPKGPLASGIVFPAEALFNIQHKAGDQSLAEFAFDAAIEGAKTVSPVDPGLSAIMPPLAETLTGVTLGKDLYTRQDIVPRAEQPLLPEQQFGPDTSRLAVLLGQANGVSPRKIDWAIRSYTAGTGEAVMGAISLGLDVVGYDPEIYGSAELVEPTTAEDISRVPGVRRLFGTRGTELERQGWESFRKATSETQRRVNELPEMNRLGIRFGEVGSTVGDRELTLTERTDYQRSAAELALIAVRRLQATADYRAMADAEKKEALRKALNEARESARSMLGFTPVKTTMRGITMRRLRPSTGGRRGERRALPRSERWAIP